MNKFKIWKFHKSRLEAFSDAVFAIVMTLLVLDLKAPHINNPADLHEVWHAVLGQRHELYSWVVSFFFVALIWLHHHQILLMATKSDYGVLWINILLLFFICLLPFPTALMAKYPHQPLFVTAWGLTVMATTLVLAWFYYYNTRNYLAAGYNKDTVKKNVRLSLIGVPVVYLVGALLAWVSVYISFVIYFFVPLLFILPLDRETQEQGIRNKE